MSLMIKVTGNEGNIMEVHKKTADKEGYVWYSYFGNPSAKPYNNKYRDVYFIEYEKLYHAELIELIKGPVQGGIRLEKSMIPYIPKDYQKNIIDNWDNCAFSLKCKNIKQIDYTIIEKLYYENNNKPFIPSTSGNGGVFYVYLSEKNEDVHVTKDLIEKALGELGKTKALKSELILKLKEIVEHNGEVLVDDEIAWKEIQNLNDE